MKQQPDLNWRNPDVKEAMWQVVRYWLDLGVDGFRLDAIGTIFEDPNMTSHNVPLTLAELRHESELATTPVEKDGVWKKWVEMFKYQWGQPGVHALMKELRRILDEYDGDRMLVGEDDDIRYHGNGKDELHLVFNFPLMRTDRLTPSHIRKNQRERLNSLSDLSPDAWPCNTLGNHDSSRLISHFGDGIHNAEIARLSLALVLTLRGTPFLYYGEEIGMTDLMLTDISQVRDTMGIWYYEALVKDLGVDPAEAMKRTAAMTRDKNRTPMQWANSPHGGFCPPTVSPWLPVNPNYSEGVNVREQENDPLSLLTYYKKLIHLRKNSPALIAGDYQALQRRAGDYYAFIRDSGEQAVLVILNFSENHQTLHFPRLPFKTARLLFSSAERAKKAEKLSEINIGAYEVYIAEVE
jgi:alpha-glucosidase